MTPRTSLSDLPSLYELERDLLAVFDEIRICDEEGIEPPPETLARIAAFTDATMEKRDRVCKFMRHVESTELAIEDEIDRLRERKKSIQRAKERMERYIMDVMAMMGVERISGNAHEIRLRNNPPHVEITDQNAVPETYFYQPPLPPLALSKKMIAEDLKAGVEIPGAKMVQGKRLEIK